MDQPHGVVEWIVLFLVGLVFGGGFALAWKIVNKVIK